jgi:hypothetical protein
VSLASAMLLASLSSGDDTRLPHPPGTGTQRHTAGGCSSCLERAARLRLVRALAALVRLVEEQASRPVLAQPVVLSENLPRTAGTSHLSDSGSRVPFGISLREAASELLTVRLRR